MTQPISWGNGVGHSSKHHQDICFATCRGPFSLARSRAAFKAFASRPAVGLLAGRGRVQHSRCVLRDLQWAFQPGVVTC
eukprot:3526277-Rhodomonas_salina.1